MLSRTKILLISGIVLMQFQAMSQTVERTIKWSAAPKVYNDPKDGKVVTVTFDGAVPDIKNGYLPNYGEKINISGYGDVTATLSNEVYEAVSNSDMKTDKIPNNIKIEAEAIVIRKRPYASVSFIPLRKNPYTGQLEKLVRFSLKVEVTGQRQLKQLNSYATNSVLSSGSWFKIGVLNTGIFMLDYNFLKNKCGFDLGNTNFSNIGIFGNGGGMVPDLNSVARYDDLQENPSYIVDHNGNNRVDEGDYLLFYGQGPDSWTYSVSNARFEYQKNYYADTNFYFVSKDMGTGKRIENISSASNPSQTITQFDDRAAHQLDQFNNLRSGKVWYGDKMTTINSSTAVNFAFPNIVTSAPVSFFSEVFGASTYGSNFIVNLNGGTQIANQHTNGISSLGVDAYANAYDINIATGTFAAPSATFSLVYNFNNPDPNGTSQGFIYNVTLQAKRALTFTGGSMFFRSLASMGSVSQFNVASASSGMHVWDISDITEVKDISGTNTGGTFSFAASTPGLSEFVAVDLNATFGTPIAMQGIANQNLHAIGQPNMLIITSEELADAANDLAVFHSQKDHMTVKVIPLKQIYNEFGSGKKDISAIRDFVKMVYDKAGSDSSKMPQYLLMFGDGSFDPKDRVVDNNNQVPTYENSNSQNILYSFTSDDYFVCLDPNEGGEMNSGRQGIDVAVGRLAAANAAEAQGMVEKIKLYKSATSLAAWRNIISVVGDEPYDKSPSDEFESDADAFGEYVRINHPAYNVDKIICDGYVKVKTLGGGRYPDANTAILNRINIGTLAMSYTGHGGPNNWANARIFNLSDIQNPAKPWSAGCHSLSLVLAISAVLTIRATRLRASISALCHKVVL